MTERKQGDPSVGRWRSILSGEDRLVALSIVKDIADELMFLDMNEQDTDFGGGNAGQALLFAYLAKATGESKYWDHVADLLSSCADRMQQDSLPKTLYGGFIGVAWVFAHLARQGIASADVDLSDVDTAVLSALERGVWRGDFDLIRGLAGISVYLLERIPETSAIQGLSLVNEELVRGASMDENGASWVTPPGMLPLRKRMKYASGVADLGMAHGAPGIVAALSRIHLGVTGNPGSERLLREAVRWILAQQLRDDPISRFPYVIAPGNEPEPTRLAWCYGDPGVAVALVAASDALQDRGILEHAVDVAIEAGKRTGDDTGVADASICHGSAGLAHIFNRLYQATGQVALLEAAVYWSARTIEMREPGAGFAGYRYWLPPWTPTPSYGAAPGFLEGATGIALVLLAAAGDLEPAWDRAIMTDLRLGCA